MSQLRQAELSSDGSRDLMLMGVKANGAVKGRLLVMSLEQRYRNSTDKNTEITYTFPLPFGAVLMDIEIELNGKILKGEVTAKSTAMARYEEAISQGDSSVMLQRNGDGSFTLELGNLMAREECKIMVRYAQTLATEHGQVRLMLPTTIAPRYGNPITQGKLQPHQVPVTDLTAEYPFDITLTLMGEMANCNVGSPSHKTSYYRNKEDLVIKLSQRGYLDRDFILVINNLKNESDALASRDLVVPGQYALMAFFSPRIEPVEQHFMAAKILVDCSGSMAGDSIDAARRALKGIVNGLAKEDKFSLSRFGSTVEHRSNSIWGGGSPAKSSAMRWIDNLQADMGGTEMANALLSTISINHVGKTDILLITDGEIEAIDDVIGVAQKSKHRVFVVAIGSSPAEVHLRRLARATGGHCDFVAPGEDVEPAVLRMSTRMRAARATNLRVEWPTNFKMNWQENVQDYAFENDILNAGAFVEEPLDLSDRPTVKLWGCVEGKTDEVLLAHAQLTLSESSINTVARLTAYAKYTEITGASSVIDETAARTIDAQELAVKYRLVTDSTNFIMVHERTEAEKALEMPEGHQVSQMQAAGWGATGSVVSGHMPFSNKALSACISSSVWRGRSAPATLDVQCSINAAVWRTAPSIGSHIGLARASGFDNIDDYTVPAFLRKQEASDDVPFSPAVRKNIDRNNPLYWTKLEVPFGKTSFQQKLPAYSGITPAGLDHWLRINDKSFWPTNYAGLTDLGLGISVCEWLEFDIGEGHSSAKVVAAFLQEILALGLSSGLTKAPSTKGSSESADSQGSSATLTGRIRQGFKGISLQSWPDAVANFPGVQIS